MAERKGSLLAKSVQKHAGRAKEKFLQNLGKVDRTADEIFDEHLTNFNRQQNNASRLQKEFNNYIRCIRAVQTASKSLMDAICDVYETPWSGAEALHAQVSAIEVLWQDFSHKLGDQVLIPLNTYTAQFPEMKKKIEKRNRKLIDYDSQRHSFQSLQANSAKRRDDKVVNVNPNITKGRDQLDEARRTYEILNTELHDELPALHDSRILFLVTNLQTLFASEQVFHSETSKIFAELEAIVDKLATDSQRGSYTLKKITDNSNQSSPQNSPTKLNSSTAIINNSYPNNTITNGSTNQNSPSSPPSSPSSSTNIAQPTPPHSQPQIHHVINHEPISIDDDSNISQNENEPPSYQNISAIHTKSSSAPPPTNTTVSTESSSSSSHLTENNDDNLNKGKKSNAIVTKPHAANKHDDDDDNDDDDVNNDDIHDDNDGGDNQITNNSSSNHSNNSTKNGGKKLTVTSSSANNNGNNNERVNGNVDNSSSKRNSSGSMVAIGGGIKNNNKMEELFDIPMGATTTDLPPGTLYRVKATYKYVKEDVDELSFEVGDVVRVIEYDDPEDQEEGWLMGQKEGTTEKGLFPANFTRPL